jgi:hypothetical protein
MLIERPEGITALDALDGAGSFRLAARIADLRAAGHDIVTEMETLSNGKRIARYHLARRSAVALDAFRETYR